MEQAIFLQSCNSFVVDEPTHQVALFTIRLSIQSKGIQSLGQLLGEFDTLQVYQTTLRTLVSLHPSQPLLLV